MGRNLYVFAVAALYVVPVFGQEPSVRITQASGASAGSALSLAGSLAHIASAGGWDTSLTLVNLGTKAGEARLSFYASDGSAWPVPYTFPQQPSSGTTVGSTVDQNLNANAVLVLNTTGPLSQAVAVGSSQLFTSGNIGGFGIFKFTPSGRRPWCRSKRAMPVRTCSRTITQVPW